MTLTDHRRVFGGNEAVTAEPVGALEDDAVVPEVMTLQQARARVGLEDLYASGSELLELATVLQLSEQPPTSCACADRYERLALTAKSRNAAGT